MPHICPFLRARAVARLGVAFVLATPAVVRADPPSNPSGPPPGNIVSNGSVYAWGSNAHGQLGSSLAGSGSATPVAVNNPLTGGVTMAAAGTYNSVGIRNGAVYAWGDNVYGQLGNGTTGSSSATPVPVSGLDNGVTVVAAGASHELAIQNGAVFAWGYNGFGELGNNSTANSSTPVAVGYPLTSGVTTVAAGGYHNLAIKNGTIYAWGGNAQGQLGNNSTTNSVVPVAVSDLSSGVTGIAGGTYHSLAIKNGALYAWGYNVNGQLGNNSVINSSAPVALSYPLDSGVTAIAGGDGHSLAVKDGYVYTWGANDHGQLGDGTTTAHRTPVRINLNHIIAVATGYLSSYALADDGSLWVWGDNSSGQLGTNSGASNYSTTPLHLLPPSGAYYSGLFVGAGSSTHALAIQFVPPSTFFTGEKYLSNGVFYLSFVSGNPFGYYAFLSDPRYFYHFDLGYEYLYDANDGNRGVYFYDFASNTTFYTSPSYPFPYLYDFTLNTVLYYYPNTNSAGHYTTNPRYFYDFATSTIITK